MTEKNETKNDPKADKAEAKKKGPPVVALPTGKDTQKDKAKGGPKPTARTGDAKKDAEAEEQADTKRLRSDKAVWGGNVELAELIAEQKLIDSKLK